MVPVRCREWEHLGDPFCDHARAWKDNDGDHSDISSVVLCRGERLYRNDAALGFFNAMCSGRVKDASTRITTRTQRIPPKRIYTRYIHSMASIDRFGRRGIFNPAVRL